MQNGEAIMSQPPERPAPASTMQVAGHVAEDVVGGLKSQPFLLGLLVLNAIGMAGRWVSVRGKLNGRLGIRGSGAPIGMRDCNAAGERFGRSGL
jgi:hypothetical protein